MGITVILIIATALSVIDMREMKKKGQTREIIVYTIYMLLAIGVSIWHNRTMFKTSVANILLRLLNLKG